MAKIKNTPKGTKKCVFCEYWMGDADLKYIGSIYYEYEITAKGRCTRKNVGMPTGGCCQNYTPNAAARRIL